MGLIYADTSVLIKRHITEQGTTWVRSWIAPSHDDTICASEAAIPEGVSVLARLQRQRFLSTASLARLRGDYLLAVETEYLIIPVNRALLMLATDLLERHPLRTLDAIHLASAIEVFRRFAYPPLFMSADQRLLAAATAEGFATDNPNNH